MSTLSVEQIDGNVMNRWLADVHYLHRPVIRSKLLGYALFDGNKLLGGALWATLPFTQKRGLIGAGQRYDKWEVLVLARMYVRDDSNIHASWFLAEMLGRSGRKNRSKRRGWRLQTDWLKLHPPVFPKNPFVPRLCMSWSDTGLTGTERCKRCKAVHNGKHLGVIYAASGWSPYGTTHNIARRHGDTDWRVDRRLSAPKICWILPLPPNNKLQRQYGVTALVR